MTAAFKHKLRAASSDRGQCRSSLAEPGGAIGPAADRRRVHRLRAGQPGCGVGREHGAGGAARRHDLAGAPVRSRRLGHRALHGARHRRHRGAAARDRTNRRPRWSTRCATASRNNHADKIIVVQIETRAALEALDDFLAIAGIDVLFLGPVDLAKSLGFAGDYRCAEMQRVLHDAVARIDQRRRRRRAFWSIATTPPAGCGPARAFSTSTRTIFSHLARPASSHRVDGVRRRTRALAD